jgi:hypothetical protein
LEGHTWQAAQLEVCNGDVALQGLSQNRHHLWGPWIVAEVELGE